MFFDPSVGRNWIRLRIDPWQDYRILSNILVRGGEVKKAVLYFSTALTINRVYWNKGITVLITSASDFG